ncbi:hypothetical protein IIB50_03080, partial [Patescibacteria group bacterium]|nr:hypothetical protein [Patescibacteria group bacterium]
YISAVSSSGVGNGDAVSAGGSKLILVNEKTPPGRSPNVFENFFDFLEKWFGKQG